jgi:hypothetical protein
MVCLHSHHTPYSSTVQLRLNRRCLGFSSSCSLLRLLSQQCSGSLCCRVVCCCLFKLLCLCVELLRMCLCLLFDLLLLMLQPGLQTCDLLFAHTANTANLETFIAQGCCAHCGCGTTIGIVTCIGHTPYLIAWYVRTCRSQWDTRTACEVKHLST